VTRVPLLDVEDLAEADRDVLARPINLYRAFAHLPELARRYREMGRWLRFESRLDPRLRELAILEVGWVTAAAYEWSHHLHIGREFGVRDADIAGLIAEAAGEPAPGLGQPELAVLRFARELTLGSRVGDALWQEVEGLFGLEQAMELCAVVAFYAMTVRFLEALEVEVEDSYLPELERYPLPARDES
jgi:alkylhydroperoxidase family enzyme